MTNTATSEMRVFAERLIAEEAADATPATPSVQAAIQVCEKLRRPLTMLAGAAGFHSLVMRALTLAKREAPSLRGVRVEANGLLEDGAADAGAGRQNHGGSGEEGPAVDRQTHTSADDVDGGVLLVAHMIGLLVTFIGKTLTLRLIEDVWPDASRSKSLALEGTVKHEVHG